MNGAFLVALQVVVFEEALAQVVPQRLLFRDAGSVLFPGLVQGLGGRVLQAIGAAGTGEEENPMRQAGAGSLVQDPFALGVARDANI